MNAIQFLSNEVNSTQNFFSLFPLVLIPNEWLFCASIIKIGAKLRGALCIFLVGKSPIGKISIIQCKKSWKKSNNSVIFLFPYFPLVLIPNGTCSFKLNKNILFKSSAVMISFYKTSYLTFYPSFSYIYFSSVPFPGAPYWILLLDLHRLTYHF